MGIEMDSQLPARGLDRNPIPMPLTDASSVIWHLIRSPASRLHRHLSPHYSWTVLLQSWIRCCDKLHTVSAVCRRGGLAAQSLNILFQVCFGSSRLHAENTAASPTRRRPQAWRSLFFAPWASRRDYAIS